MRTSEQIYHQVRWDPRFDPARFVLGVSRRQAEPKRIALPAFVPGGDIPWHRVLFVEADGELVWDRATGLDVLDRGTAGRVREPRRLGAPFFTARPVHRWDGAAGAWRAAEADPELHGAPGRPHPRVVTWNVLWDRYDGDRIATARRRPLLLAALADADADVIALQEVEPALLDLLLRTPWVRADYAVSCAPDGRDVTEHGLLLLSRLPVREAALHSLGPHKAVAALTVETATGPLVVAATHLSSDHSEHGAAKRETELAELAAGLAAVPGDLLLLGDFNDGREGALGPGTVLGMRDAWTEVHGPADHTPTFDPTANPLAAVSSLTGRAARLDRILLRPGGPRIAAAELLGRVAGPDGLFVSDHYGVASQLNLDDPPGGALDLAPTARTAVAWLPPDEVWPAIQEVRRRYDRQVHRWPPHVNLLFGFVPESAFDRAAPLVAAAAAEVAPFTARLAGVNSFKHHGDATVWLDPAADGEEPWAALRDELLRRFPRCRGRAPGFTPHLSLGRSNDPQTVVAFAERHLDTMWADVGAVVLLSRRGAGPMRPRAVVALGTGELRWLPEARGGWPPSYEEPDAAEVDAAEVEATAVDAAEVDATAAEATAVDAALQLVTRALAPSGAVIEVVGSRRMGCALDGSDLDLVAVLPGEARLGDLKQRLAGELPAGTAVREVLGARVPGLRFRLGALGVDLVLVGSGALPPAEAVARRAELGETAALALSAVSDAAAVRAAVGGRHPAFTRLAREVKAWARARGLVGAPFGGLPGLAWAVLAARTVLGHPELDGALLLGAFFGDWAAWDWQRPVRLGAGDGGSHPPGTVLTPSEPVRSCTGQLLPGSLELLSQELYRAWELTEAGGDPWPELLAGPPLHRRHAGWATVSLRAPDPEAFQGLLGRTRGRLPALLAALSEDCPDLHAWPRPFEAGPTSARYAIGLGQHPPDPARLAELTDPWTTGLPGVTVEWQPGGDVPTLR
ncbi:RNA repair domain-containing protein [Kitasatospora sp. RB6PN24]|uniref:poly(A) polymerase n=1 Tax=Kitasatospora humi TaxID=2893891 RepID=UPI001E535C8B|nr:poly(A) polymerase [Kitasatospora humi]MCC9307173.1 RNA repair domain-containing protein [Kitasatospora humi]